MYPVGYITWLLALLLCTYMYYAGDIYVSITEGFDKASITPMFWHMTQNVKDEL